MAKKNNKTEDQFAQVEGALTKTEQFIEDNQDKLVKIVGAFVAVACLFLGYQNFYLEPMEKEAQTEMFNAEIYFAKDSFNLALNGDNQYLGFLDIADDYSSTKAGKLANYYAGLSYLYLKEYESVTAKNRLVVLTYFVKSNITNNEELQLFKSKVENYNTSQVLSVVKELQKDHNDDFFRCLYNNDKAFTTQISKLKIIKAMFLM